MFIAGVQAPAVSQPSGNGSATPQLDPTNASVQQMVQANLQANGAQGGADVLSQVTAAAMGQQQPAQTVGQGATSARGNALDPWQTVETMRAEASRRLAAAGYGAADSALESIFGGQGAAMSGVAPAAAGSALPGNRQQLPPGQQQLTTQDQYFAQLNTVAQQQAQAMQQLAAQQALVQQALTRIASAADTQAQPAPVPFEQSLQEDFGLQPDAAKLLGSAIDRRMSASMDALQQQVQQLTNYIQQQHQYTQTQNAESTRMGALQKAASELPEAMHSRLRSLARENPAWSPEQVVDAGKREQLAIIRGAREMEATRQRALAQRTNGQFQLPNPQVPMLPVPPSAVRTLDDAQTVLLSGMDAGLWH